MPTLPQNARFPDDEEVAYEDEYERNPRQDQQQPYPGKEAVFLKWLINFKKEVTTPLRNLWRGYEEDESGQWVAPTHRYRVMNERGITWAISYIESYINPTFVTSNYDQRSINWTMKHVGRVVYNNLSTRYIEFGLNKLDIHRVGTEIVTKIHAILLGALNNGYRQFFMSTTFTQEVKQTSNYTPQGAFQKLKGSLLGGIPSGER